jgi:hypothetical protein
MLGVYTKMKTDSFKSQLQAVLTAYYEDIKGIQGASGCPKSKNIKRRFEDQEDAGTTPEDEPGIADAGAAAAAPAAGAAEAAPPGEEPPAAPAPVRAPAEQAPSPT